MNGHKKLFDTVSKIVNENGEGILSEPRFWGMLTDYYPFFHESKLKDVYKNCISSGWVSGVGRLPADKGKVAEFISRILESNPQDVREELAEALFSVAIAAGKCTEADYRSFINNASQLSNGQSTTKKQSASNTQPRRKTSQPKRKNRKSNGNKTVWYVSLAVVVVMAFSFINKSCQQHASTKAEEKAKVEAMDEYLAKVRENEELVKQRKDYDSTLRVKNIELGSDYENAVRYMKSSEDFEYGKENYYVFDNSGSYHPVYQMMTGRLKIMPDKGMANGTIGNKTINGRVYISKIDLYTIPVRLRVFEVNGKVHFVTIVPIYATTYRKLYPSLLELYYEKYHEPEKRTYDGMPYNPEKKYPRLYGIYEKDENQVWTFPKGMIRMGSKGILYATSDFLDSITVQYERARIESAREDSLQRVKSHENALKDI